VAGAALGQSLDIGNRESERRIQDRTYHFDEAGKDIPYSLYVPASYDSSEAHPLIVALHGLGSSAQQMIRYRGLTDLAEEYGYVVVAPEGYNSHGWYGSLGPGKNRFSERFQLRGEPDPDNLGELSEKDVFNVIGIVEKEFKIDPDRVYLMGHSMGGGGALYLGMKYADKFAGLAPIAPAIYSSPSQLQKIPSTPIIVVQGDADRLVKVEITRQWIDEMKQLGLPHKYIEIPGGDHVRVAAQNLPAIFAFFNAHTPVAR
jgi:poly(3-hydroxybutyrate) depolymerase